MKQVININFQGRVVPIEVTAFELLKNYTESLNRHFANEEGKDEIINDIENRIGELFQERLKTGATCITDDDVNAIIKSMGRPEEFGDMEDTSSTNSSQQNTQEDQTKNSTYTNTSSTSSTHKRLYRDENRKILGGVCAGIGNYFGIDPWIPRIILIITGIGFVAYFILWAFLPSSAVQVIGSPRKKLYRDGEDKLVAGVCSGIGNYFGVSAWIPRVLFLLPFLSFFGRNNWDGFMNFGDFARVTFSPGSLIIYIILWLVIPEANTTAEKLEMKGEKVDIDSIKNSVMEEMKGVPGRVEKLAKDATAFASSTSSKFGQEVNSITRRNRSSLGDIIAFIVKGFAYFIIGTICISLIIALFGFGIAAIGLFPLKDYLLKGGWQNFYAWGTLLFFIAVPIIGVITFIIRRLAKMRSNSKLIRWSFISLNIVGWICFIMLITSVGKDFRAGNTINEQEINLSNPGIRKLEVTTSANSSRFYSNKWFRIRPFEGIVEDTAIVRNVEVRIEKSKTDSFKVTMVKLVCGLNKRYADTLANLIQFNVEQKDSLLILDKGIAINKTDKFRNQRVIITVFVPVGKQIKINRNVGWGQNIRFDGPWDNEDGDFFSYDDAEHGWDIGVDYIMKADGLYRLDGTPANESKHNRNNNTKVNIGPGGIIIKDGNTDINIGPGGINIDDKGNETYRYDNNQPVSKTDSIIIKQKVDSKRLKDSLEKVIQKMDADKEKLQQLKEKLDNNDEPNDEPLKLSAYKFPVIDPTFGIN
jgi:phage shock protein PspC (stress-responsive transcriptional regulator)